MAEFDVSTGHDTWVVEADPAVNNATGRYPAVRSGDELRILLFMPLAMSQIRGRTILVATLSAPAQANWVSQTLSVRAVAANWNVATVNWNNKPAVTGATATEATGVLAGGARFEVDVTALVQAIADGQANYGWQITTSQSTDRSTLRGFDSGYASWTLSVETSDLVFQPTQLAPDGVIGVAEPVLTFDDVDDLNQVQVQVDAAADSVSPDFDSGWVAATTPQLDLSATAYAGLADGATTFWRVRVKTLNASASEWSDWAEITREDKPALTLDNPAGTDIWDPSPTIAAHLTPAGDADTRWQVMVTDVADRRSVRYNSGDAIEGATLDHTIPLTWQGQTVFPADGDYRLIVRAWDRTDRVSSPGDNSYVQSAQTVTLDVDGTITAPTDLTVTQATTGYPEITIGWERASDPDYFVVRRDGEPILYLTPDDCRVSGGVFEWPDEVAAPNVEHTYTVRAVTDVSGVLKQSNSSGAESIFATVKSVWIRSDFGDLELFGDAMTAARTDKRQTFELPYRSENVDIVTALGGFEGTYAGTLDRRSADIEADLAMIESLRSAPSAEVRVVWGTHVVWANLRNIQAVTSNATLLPNVVYDVTFGFHEIDPRD